VTWLSILGVVALIYSAVMFGPVYLDHIDVREATNMAFSVYLLEKPESAKSRLLGRLGQIGDHYEEGDDGEEQLVQGLGVAEEDVTIELDPSSNVLTIRVTYDRAVELIPTKKKHTFHLMAEKIGPATR
jgi:hypothetical protein